MDALPHWPAGTVAVLSTAGGPPHAIPVSTAVRAGAGTVLFALGRRRESLERLRRDPAAALTFLAAGLAFTAHGRASVLHDPLPGAERVAALALEVDRVQDHLQPTTAIDEGVRWRWTDEEARAADAEVLAALRALAGPH